MLSFDSFNWGIWILSVVLLISKSYGVSQSLSSLTPAEYSKLITKGHHYPTSEKDFPSDYYANLRGLSGQELFDALQIKVTKPHISRKFNPTVWEMVKAADENPQNPDEEVWFIFSEEPTQKHNIGGKNNPKGWSRLLIWPKTHGYFGVEPGPGTDGHHIRPASLDDKKILGSKNYGNVMGPRTYDNQVYEPPLSAKGDVARTVFYMALRWGYGIDNEEAVDNRGRIGKLDDLLQWHELDPVDPYEIKRNNIIEEFQSNRNPFVDLPLLADFIFGSKKGQTWTLQHELTKMPIPNFDQEQTIQPDITPQQESVTSENKISQESYVPDIDPVKPPQQNILINLSPLEAVERTTQGNHFKFQEFSSEKYSSLNGLEGEDLLQEIKKILSKDQMPVKFNPTVWEALKEADENPDNSQQVWLIFSERGQEKDDTGSKHNPNGWSRELLWPRKRGFDGIDPGPATDLHHIRPESIQQNKNHGIKNFGDVSGPRSFTKEFYEPPLSAKGDVSRSLFYMSVRYEFDLDDNSSQKGSRMGKLSDLLTWHKIDPVDYFEAKRNNIVESFQKNRNIFIDLPELVDYIWGFKKNEKFILPGISNIQEEKPQIPREEESIPVEHEEESKKAEETTSNLDNQTPEIKTEPEIQTPEEIKQEPTYQDIQESTLGRSDEQFQQPNFQKPQETNFEENNRIQQYRKEDFELMQTEVYSQMQTYLENIIKKMDSLEKENKDLRMEIISLKDEIVILEKDITDLKSHSSIVEEKVPQGIPAIYNGAIIQTSSIFDISYKYGPVINQAEITGSGLIPVWSPRQNDRSQFLQIGFKDEKKWIAVETQGLANLNQWVTKYQVKYTKNGSDWNFVDQGKVFQANIDQFNPFRNDFNSPVVAKAIRICPYEWKDQIIIKAEAYYLEP